MAANHANAAAVVDVEGAFNGHRVQPFSSTPTQLPRGEEWKSEQGNKKNHKTLGDLLGLEEFFSTKLWRASLAEVLGTASLVFMLDTIVISSVTTESSMGNPHLVMCILIAIVITIILLATAPISGGHINPVVTLSAALQGLISCSRAVVYILAQCVGGTIGALAIKAVVSSSYAHTFSLGACTLNVVTPGPDGPIEIEIDLGQALWLEIFCTFFFLYGSVWMAFDGRQLKALGIKTVFLIVGTVMALLVFVSTTITQTKGYGGVGMNPARCFGPALVRGGYLWDGHWVFWVGPLIACVMFRLYTYIIPREHFHEE